MSFLGPSSSFSTPALENSVEDGLRRVTVKQLLSAHEIQQETFCIEQQLLHHFTLVANVYRNEVILSKSKISYGFDDGSGKISGYKSETGTRSSTFAPFAYATIVGQLVKDSDGSVVVKVLYIRPLTDAYEIYFHLLHVMFDNLRYEKGNPREQDWLASQSHDRQIDDLISTLSGIGVSDRLSELEQDVMACIKHSKEYWEARGDTESLARGIQIGHVVHELSRDHQDKEALDFWDAIENLLTMGVLRTTIDDNHLDFAYSQ